MLTRGPDMVRRKGLTRDTSTLHGAMISKACALALWGGILLAFSSFAGGAVIDVTTTEDELEDDGLCSLREAVIASNTDLPSGAMAGECIAGSGTDTIVLLAETYNLTREGGGEDAAMAGDLDILDSVVIQGAGQDATLIYGNDIDRVFHVRNVPDDITVTLADLVVSHGTVNGGGGAILNRKNLILDSVWVFKSTATDGGGVFSSGSLQMTSCLVSGNVSEDDGAGLFISPEGDAVITSSTITNQVAGGTGGGIFNDGFLALETSTVEFNQSVWGGGIHSRGDMTMARSTVGFNAVLQFGGGIANEGTASIRNSTISSNEAPSHGGNIANLAGGDLELVHVTISDGMAPLGDAVHNVATVTTTGTIFNGGCAGTGLLSSNGNLESPGNTCNLSRSRDKKWVSADNLNLYPLGEYGGPTDTNLLGPGSVAIDTGLVVPCPETDQRGLVRPRDGNGDGESRCDRGAFEAIEDFFSDGFESGDASAWDEVRVP